MTGIRIWSHVAFIHLSLVFHRLGLCGLNGAQVEHGWPVRDLA